jgi:hypothetical protein
MVPGYNPETGPAIAVPGDEHAQTPTIKGAYTGTARDLRAKDIKTLRKHTNRSLSLPDDVQWKY